MLKIFLKRNWQFITLLIIYIIIQGLSNSEINFTWISDINVWVNEILLEIIIYIIMTTLTIRIKNTYFKHLINFVLTLFIGETIKYHFNPLMVNYLSLIFLLLYIILLVFNGYSSFCKGVEKGKKKIEVEKEICYKKIKELNEKEASLLIKNIRFAKKLYKNHAEAVSLIRNSSFDELNDFEKEILRIRNNNL